MKKTASTQLQPFQELLQAKEAELDLLVHRREDIAIEKSADPMDEIQYASERDLAIRNVARDSALLRQVKAALSRIRDGSYGYCADCENDISSKRLAVLPWAALCIECQEAADRNGEQEVEFLRNLEDAA